MLLSNIDDTHVNGSRGVVMSFKKVDKEERKKYQRVRIYNGSNT
jgi:hypothetical protein